jgi:hypothetical protein
MNPICLNQTTSRCKQPFPAKMTGGNLIGFESKRKVMDKRGLDVSNSGNVNSVYLI